MSIDRAALRDLASRAKERPYHVEQYVVAACNAIPALLDELDAAEAEIARLRKALEPFVRSAQNVAYMFGQDDLPSDWATRYWPTVGDFRRAAEAVIPLTSKPPTL